MGGALAGDRRRGDTEVHRDAVRTPLDNTKPDFDAMYLMASEAEPVLARIADRDKERKVRRG